MKLKKPLICLSFIIIAMMKLTQFSYGQSERFSAGIIGGFNACQIDGDMLAGFDKVGITGGIKAIMNFDSPFDLNVEFLYSQRGSRPDVFNPEYDPDINVNLQYIELPVYVTLGDWWQEEDEYYKVSAHAGFSYGRLMDARTTDYYHSADESLDNLVPYFNKNDVSWMIGVSYRFNRHLGITGRYTRGITPLLSPEKHDLAVERLLSYFLTFRAEYYF